VLGFRGATPSISSDGLTNGVLWQLTPTASVNPSFRAYDAEDLSKKLYDSYLNSLAGFPDVLTFVKFVVPTISNGKVYLGTKDSVAVFGLYSKIKSISRNPATGTVQLVFTGPPSITVQASENLVQWSDLGQGTPIGTGIFSFTDSAVGKLQRFYRLR